MKKIALVLFSVNSLGLLILLEMLFLGKPYLNLFGLLFLLLYRFNQRLFLSGGAKGASEVVDWREN